jgi:hypothetical protein
MAMALTIIMLTPMAMASLQGPELSSSGHWRPVNLLGRILSCSYFSVRIMHIRKTAVTPVICGMNMFLRHVPELMHYVPMDILKRLYDWQ